MADAFEILKDELGLDPIKEHQIVYDSPAETLEPVYFWILDFMNRNFYDGKTEKLVDNFMSSPGGGHFSELSQKKTIMQDNVMKTLGGINQVTKSIVNLVYDLKDFEIRLQHYDDAKSSNKEKAEAANLALKQIWMDNVDIKRGRGSINMLSQDLNFVTLRDAFMAADSLKAVDKLDLNDRVKRILKPRIGEFLDWVKASEAEIRKRFNIEKNYLKSQINTLHLYAKWVKPYLKAATQLEMRGNENNPELVHAFNTIVFELALMGKSEINVKEAIRTADLPKGLKIPKRKYYEVVIVKLHFRGIPGKQGQHYIFGGTATVDFKGYGMNDEELELFNKKMKDSDIEEAMKLIEGATTESLDEMKKDIDHFLEEGKEEDKKKNSNDINPFSALFSGIFPKKSDKKNKKKKEIKTKKDIKKDAYNEKLVREIAKQDATVKTFTLFDVYKKAHRMQSHDDPYE